MIIGHYITAKQINIFLEMVTVIKLQKKRTATVLIRMKIKLLEQML